MSFITELRWSIAFSGVVVLGGCNHGSLPQEPSRGGSSFAFIETPAAPMPPPKAGAASTASQPTIFDDFQEALPLFPLANPVYPAEALAAKAGLATVSVRVTVDAMGKVSDVAPSVIGFTSPGKFASDFLEAVRVAVRQWKFRPAEIEQVEWVQPSDLAPYSRVLKAEKTETHFDLVFTFTASGGVLGGAPGK